MLPGLSSPAEPASWRERGGLGLALKVMVPRAVLLHAQLDVLVPRCSSSVILLDPPHWQENREKGVGEAGGVVAVGSLAVPVGTFSFAMNLLDP